MMKTSPSSFNKTYFVIIRLGEISSSFLGTIPKIEKPERLIPLGKVPFIIYSRRDNEIVVIRIIVY